MKLGVFTVSTPDYEPVALMDKLKEFGYDGIEWRVCEDKGDMAHPSFWSGNRTTMTPAQLQADAEMLKSEAKKRGLEMPSLASYTDSSNLAYVEECFKGAVAVGAKNIRIGPGGYNPANGPFWKQWELARERYAAVAALAAKYKVKALVETHMGLLTPTTFTARKLLEGLSAENVGIMWDPGNQVVEGNEPYALALDIAGEYLGEVHAKNLRQVVRDVADGRAVWHAPASPMRLGQVDWPAVIRELKRIGYNGWIQFEDFSTEHPLDERLKGNAAWFRELLAK